MALASAQVIDGMAVRLATVGLTAGRVFTSRGHAVSEADLPCWRVVADDESIEQLTINYPSRQQHQLLGIATATTRAVDDLDDALHALASAGLTSIFDTEAHAGLALVNVSLAHVGTQRAQAQIGEAAVGEIRLLLRATFFTNQNAPDTLV